MVGRILLAALLSGISLCFVGCAPPAEPAAQTPVTDPVSNTAPAPSGSGGVQVHGGGAGMVAPVTGTENLQGGGGGVGQAAKDRAKQAGQGGSSLDQLSSDDY